MSERARSVWGGGSERKGDRVHGSVSLHLSVDEWDARVGCGPIHGLRWGRWSCATICAVANKVTRAQREVLVSYVPGGESIKGEIGMKRLMTHSSRIESWSLNVERRKLIGLNTNVEALCSFTSKDGVGCFSRWLQILLQSVTKS